MRSGRGYERALSYLGEGTLGENTGENVSMMSKMRDRWMRRCLGSRQCGRDGDAAERGGGRSEMSVHQQAGFAASTVTDDDQLSADFGHGFW